MTLSALVKISSHIFLRIHLEVNAFPFAYWLCQKMLGHTKMVLDMCFDHDKTYMYTASVDGHARSWMPEIGDEVRVFQGATRSVVFVHCKGNICEFGD